MIFEITKSVIAIIVVAGAVYAALTGNVSGIQYLVGIAGIVIGAYFGKATISAIGSMFKKK